MIKKQLICAVLLCLVAAPAAAEDYQYQYFSEKKQYTPFSDWIPKVRLHFYTVPHYVEDFYLLYGLKLYYNENTLRRNIDRLQHALQCKFRHPSEALVQVTSEEEYLKYRNLMFMHINMLILRDHLKIAARYDKRNVYFYSADFAKDIRDSLDIAEKYYRDALPHWHEAVKYARRASEIKITTDMGTVETERFNIVKGNVDFERIIEKHIDKLRKNRDRLDGMIAQGGGK
ncbi:MAG TPA: hypothetical protein PKY31_08725 [Spirochaetota bacterium]|nr:hypothetical protein [Spirochaetota bacterium]